MTTEAERLYSERDLYALGNDYIKHTQHMTSESLHSKSDIAAELAVRDIQIRQQAAEIERLKSEAELFAKHTGLTLAAKDTLLRQALEALAKYTTPGVLGGRVPIDAELVAAIKQHLGDV